MTLIKLLLSSYRRMLTPEEFSDLIVKVKSKMEPFVAIEIYDMRTVYDDDDDEASDIANEFGINAPGPDYRILN